MWPAENGGLANISDTVVPCLVLDAIATQNWTFQDHIEETHAPNNF